MKESWPFLRILLDISYTDHKKELKPASQQPNKKTLMADHDQYPCVVGIDFSAAELPGRYANGVTFSKLM